MSNKKTSKMAYSIKWYYTKMGNCQYGKIFLLRKFTQVRTKLTSFDKINKRRQNGELVTKSTKNNINEDKHNSIWAENE